VFIGHSDNNSQTSALPAGVTAAAAAAAMLQVLPGSPGCLMH